MIMSTIIENGSKFAWMEHEHITPERKAQGAYQRWFKSLQRDIQNLYRLSPFSYLLRSPELCFLFTNCLANLCKVHPEILILVEAHTNRDKRTLQWSMAKFLSFSFRESWFTSQGNKATDWLARSPRNCKDYFRLRNGCLTCFSLFPVLCFCLWSISIYSSFSL